MNSTPETDETPDQKAGQETGQPKTDAAPSADIDEEVNCMMCRQTAKLPKISNITTKTNPYVLCDSCVEILEKSCQKTMKWCLIIDVLLLIYIFTAPNPNKFAGIVELLPWPWTIAICINASKLRSYIYTQRPVPSALQWFVTLVMPLVFLIWLFVIYQRNKKVYTSQGQYAKTVLSGLILVEDALQISPYPSYNAPFNSQPQPQSYAQATPQTTPPPKPCYKDPIYKSTDDLIQEDMVVHLGDKGETGEMNIYETLDNLVADGLAYVYRPDLFFRGADPYDILDSSQIDAILLSRAGVFIIEVKTYDNCTLFVDPENEHWIKESYHRDGSCQREETRSPIWQNYAHCERVKHLLQSNSIVFQPSYFWNVAVFAGSANLMVGRTIVSEKTYPDLQYHPAIIRSSQLYRYVTKSNAETQYPFEESTARMTDVILAANDDRNPDNRQLHDWYLSQHYGQ